MPKLGSLENVQDLDTAQHKTGPELPSQQQPCRQDESGDRYPCSGEAWH